MFYQNVSANMVVQRRLELPRIAPSASETDAFTNFAIAPWLLLSH